ncbi:transporter substrate-binding domain-containing protein [Agromyces neolithicus]|uniref:Solute-binding protein family 3/N-terminal domain-containing protein n=1 Tax=Agromyces neolithicus TaxID=269420 RepID=A0ABP4YNU5_9MICO
MKHHAPARTALVLLAVGASMALVGCSTGTGAGAGAAADPDCTPQSEFSTISDGELLVVGPDYPPLFMYDGDEMSGVDGAIIADFAEANCLSPAVTVLPAASVIEAIKGGQADVAAGGWYPTDERAEVIGQTVPAYGDPAVLVGVDPTNSIEDYEGKLIGTTQGYLWSDDLQRWGGDNVKLYQSPDAVFQDLLNGRIDVALMAVNEAAYRLDQNPGTDLTYVTIEPFEEVPATLYPSVTNLPFTKDNAELGEALDTFLEEIRSSGRLAEILKEYGIDESAATPETE